MDQNRSESLCCCSCECIVKQLKKQHVMKAHIPNILYRYLLFFFFFKPNLRRAITNNYVHCQLFSLIYLSSSCLFCKMSENERKTASSNALLCPGPNDINLTVREVKKQEYSVFKFKKLESKN